MKSRLDGAEGRFVVADQVHLVDGDHDVAHAQQRRDVSMAARLDQHALAGVDQHHGGIGRGCAGGHVARVLLVARRVRNDELAARRGEVAIGNIDGDALLALGAQAVGEQRKIDLAGRGGSLAFNGAHLVFVDRLRVVEQAADERGLAVVDAAGGGEAQQIFLALLPRGIRRWRKTGAASVDI